MAEFKATHMVKLNEKSTTRHSFENGTLVEINRAFTANHGKMVMAKDESGMAQFVEYIELEPILIKV